jgi:aspartyl aminopeptidase
MAFAKNNIPWQTGEIGKIDAGGGGTIAVYLAKMGMEVIDCGVPVLSMQRALRTDQQDRPVLYVSGLQDLH